MVQFPHLNEGFLHVLASPTRSGLLYYVGHRRNRRTKLVKLLAGGFRTREKAFTALSREIRSIGFVMPKHDPMAKKVYLWEAEHVSKWFSYERLTKNQILELIYKVCGDLRVAPPEVFFIQSANFCYHARCENQRPYILMSEQVEFSNTPTVLHELAHYCCDLISPRLDNHGKLWMRWYLHLLCQYTTLNLKDLVSGLKVYNIGYWLPKEIMILNDSHS